jgi:CheY-like chemotaxis protein
LLLSWGSSEGSTFTFSIRTTVTSLAEPDAALPATSSLPPPPGAASVAPQSLRILVAEDQPQNRQLIRQVFQSRGYRAEVVENGREALDAATTRDYDLVLLDLRMPEMDGFEAAWLLRERLGDRRPPKIYALTANVFAEDRERCLKAGMDGILTKPLNFKELFDTVTAVEDQLKQPSR